MTENSETTKNVLDKRFLNSLLWRCIWAHGRLLWKSFWPPFIGSFCVGIWSGYFIDVIYDVRFRIETLVSRTCVKEYIHSANCFLRTRGWNRTLQNDLRFYQEAISKPVKNVKSTRRVIFRERYSFLFLQHVQVVKYNLNWLKFCKKKKNFWKKVIGLKNKLLRSFLDRLRVFVRLLQKVCR